MPQCIKCGREIARYGLCPSCEETAKSFAANKEKTVRHRVVCPVCHSQYVQIAEGGYKCTMCGKLFEDKKPLI